MFRSYGLQRENTLSVVGSLAEVTGFPRPDKINPWHLIDFKDFLYYLISNERFRSNGRFRPYFMDTVTHPCNNYYDLVLKQEKFPEDFLFIAKHFDIDVDEVTNKKIPIPSARLAKNGAPLFGMAETQKNIGMTRHHDESDLRVIRKLI